MSITSRNSRLVYGPMGEERLHPTVTAMLSATWNDKVLEHFMNVKNGSQSCSWMFLCHAMAYMSYSDKYLDVGVMVHWLKFS